VPRNEKEWQFNISNPLNPRTSSITVADGADSSEATTNKRARKGPQDRPTRDAATKELFRYTTAKASKDAVHKMKIIDIHGGRVGTVAAV
jgi:hypothetical protein